MIIIIITKQKFAKSKRNCKRDVAS